MHFDHAEVRDALQRLESEDGLYCAPRALRHLWLATVGARDAISYVLHAASEKETVWTVLAVCEHELIVIDGHAATPYWHFREDRAKHATATAAVYTGADVMSITVTGAEDVNRVEGDELGMLIRASWMVEVAGRDPLIFPMGAHNQAAWDRVDELSRALRDLRLGT